jgi:hypothetical protein
MKKYLDLLARRWFLAPGFLLIFLRVINETSYSQGIIGFLFVHRTKATFPLEPGRLDCRRDFGIRHCAAGGGGGGGGGGPPPPPPPWNKFPTTHIELEKRNSGQTNLVGVRGFRCRALWTVSQKRYTAHKRPSVVFARLTCWVEIIKVFNANHDRLYHTKKRLECF